MAMVFHIDQLENYIEACVRNEKWAQELIYKEYYPTLMPICLRYADHREDALDILQDGFIKIFKGIDSFRDNISLHAWMKKIMVNTAIDYYRKKIRRRTENLDSAFHISSTDPSIISMMTADEILKSIQKLPVSYRTVFNMFVIEGYSHKEIANRLNINESTSRSHLVKARSKLKNLLISS